MQAEPTSESWLDWFCYTNSHTEVPEIFFRWAGLSAIAACLGDRVWIEKFAGKPLYPNLYTILIGPSGLGKDAAIDAATELAEPFIEPWSGRMTAPGLADVLGQHAQNGGGRPHLYLVAPELSMSLGDKRTANLFIKFVTALFTPSRRKYAEAIRSVIQDRDGDVLQFDPPLLNALLGSTMPWLLHSVELQDIESGFFARTFPIIATYDFDTRITHPVPPPLATEILQWLQDKLGRISRMTGAFALSAEADAMHDRWYQTRPVPDDERMYPMYKRQDDLVYKIAMVLSADNGSRDRVITGDHMRRSIRWVTEAQRNIAPLLNYANQTTLTSQVEIVATIVQKAGRIPHATALKRAAKRGIHAKEFGLHVQHLAGRKDIQIDHAPTGGRIYVWIGT